MTSSHLDTIVGLADKVTALRKRPLIVIFYPLGSSMIEENVRQLYLLLRDVAKLSRSQPLPQVDVLVQTYGGDPLTGYHMSQLVFAYANEVEYLVPEHSYSAGTLMCCGANKILLGDLGVLSPIDITLDYAPGDDSDKKEEELFPDELGSESVETVAINHFIRVARDARVEVEAEFRRRGWRNSKTEVEGALLCEMTQQVGVMKIARYYRERDITTEYARQLLETRMFSAHERRRIESILRYLVIDAPGHGFQLDLHLCKRIGLRVEGMDEELAKATVELTTALTKAAKDGDEIFASGPRRSARLPFFHYEAYEPPAATAAEPELGDSAHESPKDEPKPVDEEVTNGHANVAIAGRS